MRVLFLNNFFYLRGGSERVMFEELRLLREAGHKVEVFSRAHERNEPAEFQEFFPPAIDTDHLGLSLKTFITVGQLIYSRRVRHGLREVIRRFNPDLAHAHNIYGRLSLSALDELRAAGVPVVMTLHDLKLLCPSYLMLNGVAVCERCKGNQFYHAVLTRCHKKSYPASFVYALESWINHSFGKYGSVRRFITPSYFLQNKCVEYGWDRSKFSYVPNFIDLGSVPEYWAGGEYLLYMGRLSREKGVGTLLQAYRRLRRRIPLMIVGDGPERVALERNAHESGIPVSFAGYLTGSALTGALKGARGVVMPSECYENAPLTILESLAAGKPVIGARIGGIPELIEDGVNGFLFEPRNIEALAETIDRYLSLSEMEISAMALAARAKIEQDYSPKRHFAGLLEVYSQALGKSCA